LCLSLVLREYEYRLFSYKVHSMSESFLSVGLLLNHTNIMVPGIIDSWQSWLR
jgi:hypothetical protein